MATIVGEHLPLPAERYDNDPSRAPTLFPAPPPAEPPPEAPTLTILTGLPVASHPLPVGRTVAGRSADADLQLRHAEISRRHLPLRVGRRRGLHPRRPRQSLGHQGQRQPPHRRRMRAAQARRPHPPGPRANPLRGRPAAAGGRIAAAWFRGRRRARQPRRTARGLHAVRAVRRARTAAARSAAHAADDPLQRVARPTLGRSGIPGRLSVLRTERYWQDQIESLREQVTAMAQPPLVP